MAELAGNSWFPFQVLSGSGVLSGKRVWLRNPFAVTTRTRIHARDMFFCSDVCVASIFGAHLSVPADCLLPQCDGGECNPRHFGVQMRVILRGQHEHKVVWVRNTESLARESFTLWMYDKWRRPVVTIVQHNKLVPEHFPLPRLSCVVTSFGKGLLAGYDKHTGFCEVDLGLGCSLRGAPECTRVDASKKMTASVRIHWRAVVPLRLTYVPFGKRGRLCGGAHPGAEVRVNGFEMDGDQCCVLYVLAGGDGIVRKDNVDVVAPAELLYSVDTLHRYIERVPTHVRAMTFTVVSEAMGNATGGIRCCKSDLRKRLCQLGNNTPAAWDDLFCLCANKVEEEDQDCLRLVVRSLRGLAEYCAAQERMEKRREAADSCAWQSNIVCAHVGVESKYAKERRVGSRKKKKRKKKKKTKMNK